MDDSDTIATGSPVDTDTDMQALSDILDKLQKTTSTQSTSLRPSEDTMAYLVREIQTLEEKQKTIQESLQQKSKELQVMRETLLVVSGALQGLQHVLAFVEHKDPLKGE